MDQKISHRRCNFFLLRNNKITSNIFILPPSHFLFTVRCLSSSRISLFKYFLHRKKGRRRPKKSYIAMHMLTAHNCRHKYDHIKKKHSNNIIKCMLLFTFPFFPVLHFQLQAFFFVSR